MSIPTFISSRMPRLILPLLLSLLLGACDYSLALGHGEHASASASSAHAGVQLQGRTGLASLDGDTVRLRDGHLLLNDQDYGVVASDATVRYRRTAAGKELSVNGKVIATLR